MADEETAAIAEYYKTHPLLEGMSVPRIRVPELTLELPLLIESHDEGDPAEPASVGSIVTALKASLDKSAGHEGISVRAAKYRQFRSRFETEVTRQLGQMSPTGITPEAVARAADDAFMRARRDEESDRAVAARRPGAELGKRVFTAAQAKDARAELRGAANDAAVKAAGSPPRIDAEIMTSEVKEQGDERSVARLKLIMKEEGLDWTVSETEGGATVRTLTPE
jgi:hypothetical protein